MDAVPSSPAFARGQRFRPIDCLAWLTLPDASQVAPTLVSDVSTSGARLRVSPRLAERLSQDLKTLVLFVADEQSGATASLDSVVVRVGSGEVALRFVAPMPESFLTALTARDASTDTRWTGVERRGTARADTSEREDG